MKFVPFFVIIFVITFKFSIADISAPPPTTPRPTATTIPPPITKPVNIEKIPAEIRKKLILNEEDIPFQYRNFISIDSNGSKHLLPSNEISYRIIVPTDIEMIVSIYVFDSESCIDKENKLRYWLGTERLFEMILSNKTYPLIFIQRTLGMELTAQLSPLKTIPHKPFAFGYVRNLSNNINGELFTYQWRTPSLYINDRISDFMWKSEPLPKFQNYNINNSTKIYFFDLNVNELGSTNCTFEFILPSYYYVAILTYDQKNATSIFEEFSSTNLLGFIAGGIAVILVLVATIGGCIYLVYLGVLYYSRFNTNSLSLNHDSIESSIILQKNQNRTASKSGDGEQIIFEEHLIGCFCARCRRKKRDKEKLIQSLEPNAKKIITKYISSGLNLNAIKIQSQTEFTKLITVEMKKRKLKLKKGEIEALLQKFVNHENVKVVIEQINASKNSALKNDNNFKV